MLLASKLYNLTQNTDIDLKVEMENHLFSKLNFLCPYQILKSFADAGCFEVLDTDIN